MGIAYAVTLYENVIALRILLRKTFYGNFYVVHLHTKFLNTF